MNKGREVKSGGMLTREDEGGCGAKLEFPLALFPRFGRFSFEPAEFFSSTTLSCIVKDLADLLSVILDRGFLDQATKV